MKIEADNPMLQYCGRIDFDDPKAPVLVYAGSFVKLSFSGTKIAVRLRNHRSYYNNAMGYILDGEMGKFDLPVDQDCHLYEISNGLEGGIHELMLYKRQDGCHYVTFEGFELAEGAEVFPVKPLPERKIEVFGDSISCGEVCEALDRIGDSDPEGHEGIYSNSYYSYSWILARKLNAQVHISSQGGLALMDKTGWFHGPDFVGLESTYDKIQYNTEIGATKPWDFTGWQPDLVILAIGQNDANPENYMMEDYDGEKAENWRTHYRAFIEKLLSLYPGASIVLSTTILNHDASWDRAIEQVCSEIASSRVKHFLYENNGCGTPGHVRIPEAESMAEQLADFIRMSF